MKMNCGIVESCVAIVTKHKSSKGTPKLTWKLTNFANEEYLRNT